MILNSWNCITLVCGNHGEDYSNVMEIKQGPHSLFYSCPKYHSIYSKEEQKEVSCNNRLTMVDYERLLEHLLEESEGDFGMVINLDGHVWKNRGVIYKVLKHENDHFTVAMQNIKAINKK